MQPRCSDRVWEPPAARAPVSSPQPFSRVRPMVVIDSQRKERVCVTVARIQRHGPPEFRMSRSSWPYCLLLRTSGGLPVGSRIGGNAILLIPRLIGLRDSTHKGHTRVERRAFNQLMVAPGLGSNAVTRQPHCPRMLGNATMRQDIRSPCCIEGRRSPAERLKEAPAHFRSILSTSRYYLVAPASSSTSRIS